MHHARIGVHSKGSWQRPQSVSNQELELRKDLLFCKSTEEREGIKKKILQLQNQR